MGIDITMYLMREGTTLDAVLDGEKEGAEGYVQVGLREGAEFEAEHVCYVKKVSPNKAKWAGWVEEVFDFGGLTPQNQNSCCVIAIRSGDRVFALTFGTGRHALSPRSIEPDFGLRVALSEQGAPRSTA